MRSRIVRALATSAATAMLAGGAVMVPMGTAFAAPAAHAGVTAGQHTPTARHCRMVKGHYRMVTVHGKHRRIWVKSHWVCTGR
jgi:hypothetical protein